MKLKHLVLTIISLVFISTSADAQWKKFEDEDKINFLSNVNLSTEEALKDYQALYASQAKGVFYIIFGKFELGKDENDEEYIKKIEFVSVNYRKPWTSNIIFTRKNIGFLNPTISPNRFTINDNGVLNFNLPIKKRVKSSCSVKDIDYYENKIKNTSCYSVVNFPDTSKKLKSFNRIHIDRIHVRNKDKGMVMVKEKGKKKKKEKIQLRIEKEIRKRSNTDKRSCSKAFTLNCDESELNVIKKEGD